MDILLSDIWLVLFGSIVFIPDKLKVSYTLQSIIADLFESEPIILPIPEDALLDIPRIELSSIDKDKRGLLSVARNRIDLKLGYSEEDTITSLPLPHVFKKLTDILQYLVGVIHTQVTRCAMVTDWIVDPAESSSAKFISSKYLRSEVPIIEPDDLELHYLTKEIIAGFKVNKWTKIQSARKKVDQIQEVIVLHIDINTVPEITYQFTQNSLQLFLDQSSKIVNETIEQHLKIWGDNA